MFDLIVFFVVSVYIVIFVFGYGLQVNFDVLLVECGGLCFNVFFSVFLLCWIGQVDGVEDVLLFVLLMVWECCNNWLAWLGLNQDGFFDCVVVVCVCYGVGCIVLMLGIFIVSIGVIEEGYCWFDVDGGLFGDLLCLVIYVLYLLCVFVVVVLGLEGLCLIVFIVCLFSVKVFVNVEWLIWFGLVDVVVVGGVDILCDSVLFGFNVLELVLFELCMLFDVDCCGILIGEVVGFVLLECVDVVFDVFCLIGYGEFIDVYYMFMLYLEGLGVEFVLCDVLVCVGIIVGQVDYINLYGMVSQKNDEVEVVLVSCSFELYMCVSFIKGFIGYMLGVVGIVEVVIILFVLCEGLVLGNLGGNIFDFGCGLQFVWYNEYWLLCIVLSNLFGFGGNNVCFVFVCVEVVV